MFKKVLGFLKDCDKIKFEGIVTTVDQKTVNFLCLLVKAGDGLDLPCSSYSWRNFSDQSSGVWQTERNELQENSWRNSCFETMLTGSSVS